MEDRVIEVEIRLAYLEHELRELDGVVRETRDLLDRLRREVGELRDRVEPAASRDPDDEVPPHY